MRTVPHAQAGCQHLCWDPIHTVPFSLGKLNTGFEITPYEYMAYDMVESTEGSFQAACREFIIPTEAGIQKGPTGFRVTHGMTSQNGGLPRGLMSMPRGRQTRKVWLRLLIKVSGPGVRPEGGERLGIEQLAVGNREVGFHMLRSAHPGDHG